MVAIYRGPGVVGYDTANAKPKGVVSPSEHRMGMQAIALAPGIFQTTPNAAALTTSTTSRNLQLSPACAAISAPLGGWYLPSWRSAATLTPDAGGSQDRIDVVYVEQADYEVNAASTDSAAQLAIAKGVASATPSAPSLTDGQLALYQVRVHAGDTTSSQFTLARVFVRTAPAGGVLRVPGVSSLAQLPSIDGLRALDESTGITWTYGGSAWSTEKTMHMAYDALSLVGTPTDAMAPIIKAGTTVLMTDLNGFGSVIYRTPFPSGLISVVAVNGDNTVHKGYVDLGTSQQTTDQIHFRLDGVTAPHLCRINWIAIGW